MQKRRRKRRNRSKRSLGYTEDAAEGTHSTAASLVLHFHVDDSPFDTFKFFFTAAAAVAETSSLSLFTLLKAQQGICPVYFSTHTRSTAAAAAQFTNHVAS